MEAPSQEGIQSPASAGDLEDPFAVADQIIEIEGHASLSELDARIVTFRRPGSGAWPS
jgi:hypothetical protein